MPVHVDLQLSEHAPIKFARVKNSNVDIFLVQAAHLFVFLLGVSNTSALRVFEDFIKSKKMTHGGDLIEDFLEGKTDSTIYTYKSNNGNA